MLQPGTGRTRGTYLRATPQTVTWGELPNRNSAAAAVVASGGLLTLDGVSHEGVLEDQGKDPVAYFGSKGVPGRQVLDDAIDIAAHKVHTGPGPHVVTGPVAVRGAEKGDVLQDRDPRSCAPCAVRRHLQPAWQGCPARGVPGAVRRDTGGQALLQPGRLSATAHFVVSQVVDRTTGIHGLIRKADFGRD